MIRPWTLKLELSQSCNLSCDFCPIDNYGSQPGFLPVEDAIKVGEQMHALAPKARVEMAMRGEPTMNPNLVAVVAGLRRAAPKLQLGMFSNGVNFLKHPHWITELLDAGLNILNIDCYNNTYDRFQELVRTHVPTCQLTDCREFSPYRRHPRAWKMRVVNLVPDLPLHEVRVRKVHNYGGNVKPTWYAIHGEPKALPLAKKCARPFREVVVLSNGDVSICCLDWKAERVLGNIHKNTLTEIWEGENHRAVLEKLYDKQRDFAPCKNCDYFGGFRMGFLKDPREEQ